MAATLPTHGSMMLRNSPRMYSGMKSCRVRIPTTGCICKNIESLRCKKCKNGGRVELVGSSLTPGVLGTTHMWRRPSSRKRAAALASDMFSTTVYGDRLAIGWRSTYMAISSSVMSRSSTARPLPEPGLAKSNGASLRNTSAAPVLTGWAVKALAWSSTRRWERSTRPHSSGAGPNGSSSITGNPLWPVRRSVSTTTPTRSTLEKVMSGPETTSPATRLRMHGSPCASR
uniref:Uncharacterized protein n=1 Tax=Oryza brachyantha TaxID=4533 RepID=J3L6C9_ORYBR